MGSTFVVYIDESGDEGFVFRDPPQKGSSDWFILSAIIIPQEQDSDIKALAAGIRASLGFEPKHVLHFAKLDHEKCVCAIDAISRSRLTATSVLVNKRAMRDPAIFQAAPFRLYYYTARLLLERVSWYCRDTAARRGRQSPLARIIFEHRKRLSYENLNAYLDVLRGQAQMDAWFRYLVNDVRIHWPVIENDHIEAAQKAQYSGLQIADLVASGFRWALERCPYGHTEHRYAKTLVPVVYRHNHRYLSYGLKFFPEGVAANDPTGHWVRKHYT